MLTFCRRENVENNKAWELKPHFLHFTPEHFHEGRLTAEHEHQV